MSDKKIFFSNRWTSIFGTGLSAALFVVAFVIIHQEIKAYHYHDIVHQLTSIPARQLILALLLTILNYLVLTGYDFLALYYVRHPLQYGKTILVSFISYVFSYNVGLSIFGGGAIRYRMYSGWGLSTEEIAKVIGFCIMTLWIGLLSVGGILFLIDPLMLPETSSLPFLTVRPIGFIFLLLITAYLIWNSLGKKQINFFRWKLELPSLPITLTQIVLSSADWMLAALVLYIIIPPSPDISYLQFVPIFILAQLVGLISHVPGGLGVFETVILFFLSDFIPASAILGSLLIYRLIYYLLPLLSAVFLLACHEVWKKRKSIKNSAITIDRWVWGIIPQVFMIVTFAAGIVLLFSGATPEIPERLSWINKIFPLPVVEMSHFLGSMVGTGLLFIAWGLQQRLDAAYFLTIFLLVSGIFFSLLKGLDYEESTILLVILISILPCRKHFYRKTSFVQEKFTPGWLLTIALALASSIWLGIFSFKHVEYSDKLWWRFELLAEAPRFLRAAFGALSAALFIALYQLFRPAANAVQSARDDDQKKVSEIVSKSSDTMANLALLGDKKFLFSKSGKTFLMYGTKGRSWIAMGDPVGPEEEFAEVIWKFRKLCDEHHGWPVFYQIGKNNLYIYIDMGLELLKLGEDAKVDLQNFSLEGGDNRGLRHTVNRFEKENYIFEILPIEKVPEHLLTLRQISDSWLKEKNTREKKFSLGSFSETYIQKFPVAVLKKENAIVAFANLWTTVDKKEFSADLMRYLEPSPSGVMEYLFIRLMSWGKQEGYGYFRMGMAPLSGLEDSNLSPLWNRLGHFLFRYGEPFYNFQGLRDYKEKFHPLWEPKYMASPGGLAVPRILTNAASLVADGLKGVVSK